MKEKSTRQKGTQFQGWVNDWILKQYPDAAVHNFKSTARQIIPKDPKKKPFWVSTDQDLWNCIDLACYLPFCGKPIFIQATAHSGVDKRIQEMTHVPWNFDHVIVQLFQKKEIGRVVIQQLRSYKGVAIEFYKIGEIKRGKYVPFIGKTLCDGAEPSVEAL